MDLTQSIDKALQYLITIEEKIMFSCMKEKSLEIDFFDLASYHPDLTEQIMEEYDEGMRILNLSLETYCSNNDLKKPYIRLFNISESRRVLLGNIRSEDIGKLIFTDGKIRHKGEVKPRITRIKVECPACVPKGTLVHTPSGLTPIELVSKISCVDYNMNLRSVIPTVINVGEKEVWIINDDVECSGNHQWFVYRNGITKVVQTKDLNIGDELYIINDKQMCYLQNPPSIVLHNKQRKEEGLDKKNMFNKMQRSSINSNSTRIRESKTRQPKNKRILSYREKVFNPNSKNTKHKSQTNKKEINQVEDSFKKRKRTSENKYNEQFETTSQISKTTSKSLIQAWKTMWRERISEERENSPEMCEMRDKSKTISSSYKPYSYRQQNKKFDDYVQIMSYKLTSIRNTQEKKEMYDLIVPNYNNFILENNLITHNCGNVLNILQTTEDLKIASRCSCGRKGPMRIINKEYVDTQYLSVQENFKDLQAGEQPRYKTILLTGKDLTNPLKERKYLPGNTIRVIGVIKEIQKKNHKGTISTTSDLIIEANNIINLEQEMGDINISSEEEEKILEVSKDPKIYDYIYEAIAPGIMGCDVAKRALILFMFNGSKNKDSSVRTDTHLLFIGDPATGKSQLLNSANEIHPRSCYLSGPNVSAAGITATVTKDEKFGWILEGGPLTIYNNGVVIIDEFEKADIAAQNALHVPLEQQKVIVAKANISTELVAETQLLCAANPVDGRFYLDKDIKSQINLPDTLFSVDYSEPLLIKKDGKIELVKIGEFIDKYYVSEKDETPLVINDDVKVVSMNPQNFKMEWKPIKYVFRHSLNDGLKELVLETGRRVKITEGHSIYVWKHGEIKHIPTKEITTGDYVIIPKTLPITSEHPKEINLVTELLKLPEKETKTIYLHNVPREAMIRMGIKNPSWKNRRMLPFSYSKLLNEQELKTCVLKSRGGVKNPIPIIIPLNGELSRLLGYYVAEGSLFVSTSSSHLISLAFHRKETHLHDDIKRICKNLFNHDVSIVKDSRNGMKVNIANKIVYLLFSKILKLTRGSHNKRIPEIIFNLSKDNQKEFLRAYHDGDYCTTVSKYLMSDLQYLLLMNDMMTASSTVDPYEVVFPDGHIGRSGISYRLNDADRIIRSMKGIKKYSYIPLNPIKETLISISQLGCKGNYAGKKKSSKYITGDAFWKKIFRPDVKRRLKVLTLLREPMNVTCFCELCGIGKKDKNYLSRREYKRQYLERLFKKGLVSRKLIKNAYYYSTSERGFEAIKKINVVKKLLIGDLAFVKVKEINDVNPSNKYVYDVSVETNENFVAGIGGILCHNSRFDLVIPFVDKPSEHSNKLPGSIITKFELASKGKVRSLLLDENNPFSNTDFLRKYLLYVIRTSTPLITRSKVSDLEKFYNDLKKMELNVNHRIINLRQMDALVRLSMAHAKITMKQFVTKTDTDFVIKLFKDNWKLYGYDVDAGAPPDIQAISEGGISYSAHEKKDILLDTLDLAMKINNTKTIIKSLIKELLLDSEIFSSEREFDTLFDKLVSRGDIYRPKTLKIDDIIEELVGVI